MSNFEPHSNISFDKNLTIEVVRPDDGRLESFWVVVFIMAVVLLGAVGVYARQQPETLADPSAILDSKQRQLLLELSIAVDEIHFMKEISGKTEILFENLIEQGALPTFVGQSIQAWTSIDRRCFLLSQPNSAAAFALWLETEDHTALFFTPNLTILPNDCRLLSTWIEMDNNE